MNSLEVTRIEVFKADLFDKLKGVMNDYPIVGL